MADEEEIKPDTGYDAGDPQQVNAARRKAGRLKNERLEFVQAMMDLPQGRKWLWELLERCSIFDTPLVPGDPYATHYKLGEKNIGMSVLQDAMQFPERYMQMCTEAKGEK